ncbi:hypothetical protein [Campylobacter sp. 9BO]
MKNGNTLLIKPTQETRNNKIVIANINSYLYIKKAAS